MTENFYIKIIILFSIFNVINCLFDPITLGAVGIVGSSIYALFKSDKLKELPRFFENCESKSAVPYDLNALKSDLNDNLYGQHIVNTVLLPALKSHVQNLDLSQKPLVLSFHGLPGIGKNYVADMIVKHFYRDGDESPYVHRWHGRNDFPLKSEVPQYRINLSRQITEAVSKCKRSIFIFDEVDKVPEGVFESLASLLDHHKHVNNIDFRKSIFIFLTNSGGPEIAKALDSAMVNGKYRDQTKIQDFEPILEMAAYNVDGGLKNAGIIKSSLVDHFIPFLPLEKIHVKKCIVTEFGKFHKQPTDEQVEEAASHVSYQGKFANFGCKRLNKKVAVMVAEW